MIDTEKYIEDVEEKYNLIMNLMDDEEREFEIKTRIRERNKIMVAYVELDAEVKRLREALDWVRREETRKEADYIWEGVDEILAGDPRWKEMIE